jgi:hypothetical protein
MRRARNSYRLLHANKSKRPPSQTDFIVQRPNVRGGWDHRGAVTDARSRALRHRSALRLEPAVRASRVQQTETTGWCKKFGRIDHDL